MIKKLLLLFVAATLLVASKPVLAQNVTLTVASNNTAMGTVVPRLEGSEQFNTTLNSNYRSMVYTGDVITMEAQYVEYGGMNIGSGRTIVITAANGGIITDITFQFYYGSGNANKMTSTAGTVNTTAGNSNGSVTDINSSSVTFASTYQGDLTINRITINYRMPIIDNHDGTYSVEPGTTVTLLATPQPTYYMKNWNNGADINQITTVATDFTINESRTITANFALCPILTLGVNNTAAGSLMMPSNRPVIYNDVSVGDTLFPGDLLQLPNNSAVYVHFNANRYKYGGILATRYLERRMGGDTIPVEMDGSMNVKGVFSPVTDAGDDGNAWVVTYKSSYEIDLSGITVSGGSLPEGVAAAAAPNSYYVGPGIAYTVKAIPNTGYYLSGWSNNAAVTDEGTTEIIISESSTLTAIFEH